MIYLIITLLVWTGLGIWFFLTHMGDKYRKGKWYDFIILAPVFALVPFLWLITYILGD